MKFLIDTNVFIPLEPDVGVAPDVWTAAAVAFSRAATGTGQQLFVHPAARQDIERIRTAELKATRLIQFDKYAELPEPPVGTDMTRRVLGTQPEGSNAWVDDQLVVALHQDAADYLVSEDNGVHRKAAKLGLADRTLRLREAVQLLNRLITRRVEPAPLVVAAKVHTLLRTDPIFDTLRSDYTGFDDWITRAARQHRDAWFIENSDGSYAAVAIVKVSEARRPERHLKLCCFKIADDAQGKKYGELMLRQIFDHSDANNIASCYVTVFPKYMPLIALLEQFGFQQQPEQTPEGENVYAKRMVPNDSALDPLAFHVAFGPRHVRRDVPTHVAPILPRYEAMLFPEQQQQLALVPQDRPFGNAILKAYLCHAPTRQLQSGNLLFFYRSQDEQAIRHLGVVESTLVSCRPEEVARFVGLRTVYTLREIEEQCADGDVLAIKFRHARTLERITLETLLRCRILKGAPQSIQQLAEDSRELLWKVVDEGALSDAGAGR